MIVVVLGTRPEFIKCGPVVSVLRRQGLEVEVWHTGQHTDLTVDCDLEPDRVFHVEHHPDPKVYLTALENAITEALRPDDMVLVQGDTTSAAAGALAATNRGLWLGHIEAGVRSWDRKNPYPEEDFRVLCDQLATVCFCATEQARQNLRREGAKAEIHVVGNPGIDALYRRHIPVDDTSLLRRVLVTLHRRESHNGTLTQITEGIYLAAHEHPELKFLWPMHPNPEVIKWVSEAGNPPPNVYQCQPINPEHFAWFLAHSRVVVTDSGGVQEEAAALGVPCVVARDVTDRPESVESRQAVVAGRSAEGVYRELVSAINGGLRAEPTHVFGDGRASSRIAAIVAGALVPSPGP